MIAKKGAGGGGGGFNWNWKKIMIGNEERKDYKKDRQMLKEG